MEKKIIPYTFPQHPERLRLTVGRLPLNPDLIEIADEYLYGEAWHLSDSIQMTDDTARHVGEALQQCLAEKCTPGDVEGVPV